MTPETALSTLIRATEVAQRKGAYSLVEAATVWEAIHVLTTPPKSSDTSATDLNQTSNLNLSNVNLGSE